MNLCVAVRMNQQSVICRVRPSQRLIDDVVVMPTGHVCDGLATDRAEPLLLTPEVREHPFTLQVVFHLYAEAPLQIEFPCWVIRIAVPLDFDVTFDGSRISQTDEVFVLLTILISAFAKEPPTLFADRTKVFIFDPPVSFVGVSSACPSPQRLEDGGVHIDKGFMADDVSVVICPSSNFRIEQSYQSIRRLPFC